MTATPRTTRATRRPRRATRRTTWEQTPAHQARMSAADLRGTLGATWREQIATAPDATEHADGSWTWTP